MNRTLEEGLDKLKTRLIRMGSLVEEQVEFAMRALLEGNQTLAQVVIERDDKVDKLDLKIDKQCQRIFALTQPVASDLRLLLAAIKINNELERIGDQAVGTAEIASRSPGTVELARMVDLKRLTTNVHRLFKTSIDSFINNDPDLAAHLIPADSTIDTIRTEVQNRIIEVMKSDPSRIDDGAQLLICTHQIGRIADHATNIAENVIFLVRAKLVRHRSIEDIAEEFGTSFTDDNESNVDGSSDADGDDA